MQCNYKFKSSKYKEGITIVRRAIIGGTGVYEIDELATSSRRTEIDTDYGSVTLDIKEIKEEEYAFLARHGRSHSLPPHQINYRANMKALKNLGVRQILATTAAGSCHEDYPPGALVLIEDFIDFTRNRNYTYFDDTVRHLNMENPYCPYLNKKIQQRYSQQQEELLGGGVYGAFPGPRFETAAEVEMANKLGVKVMGMTNVPESILARELGMCYANVSIVVNWGTGFKKEEDLDKETMRGIVKEKKSDLLFNYVEILSSADYEAKTCTCHDDFIV